MPFVSLPQFDSASPLLLRPSCFIVSMCCLDHSFGTLRSDLPPNTQQTPQQFPCKEVHHNLIREIQFALAPQIFSNLEKYLHIIGLGVGTALRLVTSWVTISKTASCALISSALPSARPSGQGEAWTGKQRQAVADDHEGRQLLLCFLFICWVIPQNTMHQITGLHLRSDIRGIGLKLEVEGEMLQLDVIGRMSRRLD